MFQGSSQLTLDAKGRLSMPTRHREALHALCDSRLTLTRHPDGCLLIYPRPRWEAKREEIARLPYSARALQRLLLGSAMDVELDAAGRLQITSELRGAAGLERDAMLLGMGEHFELWDAARHESTLQEQLPHVVEAVAGFTF